MMTSSNPPATVGRPASLLANRSFTIYWLGQGLSALGDAFAMVAMPLLVLEATGSVAQMGMVTAVFGAAQLVMGVFAGVIVDRADRRKLMIACDVGRAVLYALVPIGWAVHGPSMPLVYLVTGLGSALGNLFGVAYVTATTSLVEKEQLTEANARLQGAVGGAFVLGPMLAGIVSSRLGPTASLGINAASFAVSAVSLAALRFGRAEGASQRPGRVRDELREGLSFLVNQPVLRAVTVFFALLSMLAAGVLDLVIFRLKHEMLQGDQSVGMVLGASAVGAVAGALVASKLRARLGFAACFLGGTVAESIAVFATALAPSPSFAAAAGAFWSMGITVRAIASMSLRQQITPDRLLGRVTAAFWTLGAALGPLGAAASTRVAEKTGSVPVLIATASVGLAICLGALFSPLSQARPEAQGSTT